MACRYPVQIRSPLDDKKFIYVPCGRCAWCRKDKRNDWYLRFKVEEKASKFTDFVTLTYSDENLPFYLDEETGEYGYRANKKHIQDFIKRLRKLGYKFKYFIVSEYAPKTKRPHYHGLFFSDEKINPNDLKLKWQHGHTDQQPAGEGSLKYVTKYILKGNDREGNFMLCSKRPAIGSTYITKAHAYQTYQKDDDGIYQFVMPTEGGNFSHLPRYYKKKFKDFFDELDFDLNNVKLLKKMETDNRFSYLERKFARDNPDLPIEKAQEMLNAKYLRDVKIQNNINNKSKL